MSPNHPGTLSHVLVISYSLSGYVISWRNTEPHFMQWIGLPVISMPWRLTSMTLISESATIMPQVSTVIGVTSQYPSQVLSPSLMADNNLTLPASQIYSGDSGREGGHQM